MGIPERLDDAEFLYAEGRFDAALMMAVVAVAATAQRKYPRLRDRERWERLMRDARLWRMSVEFRGEQVPVETLLYKWVRNQLIHEATLPVDLVIAPTLQTSPDELVVRAGGAPEYVVKLSPSWFHHLLDIVRQEPVNADLFSADPDAAMPT